jgi:effector-binding domain-containing protein
MRYTNIAAAFVACSLLCAALSPSPVRGADDVQLSNVAVRTLSPQTILYQEIETSLSELGEAVGPILERLEKLVKEKKVVYTGSTIFVYQGATADPTKKFKLQVSFAVVDGTEAQGGFKVRRLEPFKCATVLYGGPIPSISQAYEKVYGGLGGNTPTGESREYYLHFEGVDSPNNVQVIAVGVK